MRIVISQKNGIVKSITKSLGVSIQVSSSKITAGMYILSAGLVNVYTKDEVREITGYDRDFVIDINNIVNNI